MGNCEKHQMLYKLAKKYITICGSTSSSYHKLNADTEACWDLGTSVRRNGQHFKLPDFGGCDGSRCQGFLRREDMEEDTNLVGLSAEIRYSLRTSITQRVHCIAPGIPCTGWWWL